MQCDRLGCENDNNTEYINQFGYLCDKCKHEFKQYVETKYMYNRVTYKRKELFVLLQEFNKIDKFTRYGEELITIDEFLNK